MYYLQSRYYSPEWGRFVNADGLAGQVSQLISHNLFLYCSNNPINMIDDNGYWPKWVGSVLKAAAGVAIVAAAVTITCVTFGAAAPVGAVIAAAAIGSTVGVGTNIAKQMIVDGRSFNQLDVDEVISAGVSGGVSGALAITPINKYGQAIGNAIISGTSTAINGGTLSEIGESAAYGGLGGFLGGDGAYYAKAQGGIRNLFFNNSKTNSYLVSTATKGILQGSGVSPVAEGIKSFMRRNKASAVSAGSLGRVSILAY